MDSSGRLEPSSRAVMQRWEAIPAWFLTKDGYWLYARLIRHEDAPRLLEMFDRLSSETRRRRFHATVDYIDEAARAYYAHNFATVDNLHTGGAVVAVDHQGAGQKIVGVLRLGAPEEGCAEVGVVVRDDFQGRGVGRALLQRLPTLAQRMGVHTVTGSMEADNLPAIRLFRGLHFPMTLNTSHAETQMRIALSSPALPSA
ncbi:MAG: GNAT family N-acetyltransferase [Caldilineaceae bacterium]|nr:GNAT family N-acetyltransferase [Caldilineaceae bacterium]